MGYFGQLSPRSGDRDQVDCFERLKIQEIKPVSVFVGREILDCNVQTLRRFIMRHVNCSGQNRRFRLLGSLHPSGHGNPELTFHHGQDVRIHPPGRKRQIISRPAEYMEQRAIFGSQKTILNRFLQQGIIDTKHLTILIYTYTDRPSRIGDRTVADYISRIDALRKIEHDFRITDFLVNFPF